MILKTQKNIFNIMASTNANSFIYYFKRIPFIGKILPDSIYGNITLKKRVAVLAQILKVFGHLFGKALFIGLLIFLPVTLIEKNPSLRYQSFIHIFFMISFIGSFLTSSIFTSDRNKYICIRLMRMDAKSYIVSTVLFQDLKDILYFMPVLMFSAVWMGGTLLQGFLLTIVLAGSNLIGEAFYLLFYSKTGIILCKKPPVVVAVGVSCLAAAYIPVLLHKPFILGELIFHPACILFFLALNVLCVWVVARFNKYHSIAAIIIKGSSFAVDTNKVIGEARFSDVAMREKEFTESDLKSDRFENKKGFAYLNAIFFERHKRLLVKPIIIRVVIVAVLFCAAIAASFFVPEFLKPISNPGKILPAFVFLMYLASIGERVCKAMFYNCDISLLRYSFYRDKNAILSNFKVRLLKVAGLNLIVAAVISVAVVSLSLIFNLCWSTVDSVFFVLSILCLALFFSVHHLFLYYVFQPYTRELGMKNPFYSGINTGVYLLCYFCLRIKSAPSYFTLIILLSTILYIIVALILVYKYAPKTFRVN